MSGEWDRLARDVRASLAACAVEIVDSRTAGLTYQQAAPITAQIWGDFNDLMYPPTKENTRS